MKSFKHVIMYSIYEDVYLVSHGTVIKDLLDLEYDCQVYDCCSVHKTQISCFKVMSASS